MALITELRRRNVLRMAVLYAVSAWLIMQVVGVLLDLAPLPQWIGSATLVLLAVGFPIALVMSWFYELTPDGVSLEDELDRTDARTPSAHRNFNVIVISLLSAAILLFAIDKWWTGPPTDKSIAVLPFDNMSTDPEQEYFSDGIAEELLNVLAQVPELRVISRSSSFAFKNKDFGVPEIAERLNVAYVLEGSVRRDADTIRITAQLIEAGSDFHVWSESYDRELEGIFDIQDEIAAAITDALKLKLAIVDGAAVQPSVIQSASTDAYDAYLEARELSHKRGTENYYAAIEHLKRALNLDADFAPAHALLAIAYTQLYDDGEYLYEDAVLRAEPHLDRAQELEPDLAEAHGGRALLALSVDAESAAEHARKALESNPNYADAMNWLFLALGILGRDAEAEPILDQLLVMDPLSVVGRTNYAMRLINSGRIEEAREIADQFVAEGLDRGNAMHISMSLYDEGDLVDALHRTLLADDYGEYRFVVFMYVGEYDEARRASSLTNPWIDLVEGNYDAALKDVPRWLERFPDDRRTLWQAAEFYYDAGRLDEALPLYDRLREFVAEGRPIPTSLSDRRSSNETTMRLAHARRVAGDEAGAVQAAEIVKRELLSRVSVGRTSQTVHRTEAMVAAFERDAVRAASAVREAIRYGLRDRTFLEDAIFDAFDGDSGFTAARDELAAVIEAERQKVLQLICINNPAPDVWRPMPETCEGV